MSHYKDNDPETGVVHSGHINNCLDCESVYELHELVAVSEEDAASASADAGTQSAPLAVIDDEPTPTTLPKWMPPAALDTPKPPEEEGPSLIVANPSYEDGSLPGAIQTKLPPTSSLPPWARKRWNIAAITGPEQTEFKVRRGDDPVKFVITGTKQDAVDVIVALSLVDRVDRNCMRVALIANPELLAELPADVKEGFDKYEVAKGHEFMSWLRKRGRSMLAMGARPWQGKVGGAAPDVHSALKALGLGNPGGNGGDAN